MNFDPRARQNPRFAADDGDERFQTEEGHTLLNLLRTARLRWRLVAGAVVIINALMVIVLLQLTPVYTASSVVMLDQRKNNIEDLNAALSGLPTDPTSIENQVQILRSRDLATRVINRLDLRNDPEFGRGKPGWIQSLGGLVSAAWFSGVKPGAAAVSTEKNDGEIVDAFEKHLDIGPVGLSSAIALSFQSGDPKKSARIANAVADEYVQDQLNAKFEATQKATQWLSDRLQKLSEQVQAAETAVQQYKADNNISETTDGTSIIDQQLASVNGQLVLARSDLAEKQASYARVSALVRAGRAADVSQVVTSPLVTTLRGQETDLGRQEADLSTQFGPRHPKILELESEKKNLQARIAEEVDRVVQTVANDVAVAQANVSSLQASLTQLESKSQGQSEASVKLKALEATASSGRAMYEAYLGRLKEAQGQEKIQTPDARVISAADVPEEPSFPRKGLIVGATLPASLLLGLMLAFAAERLDSGFRTSEQIEGLLRLPVLGVIPEIGGSKRKARAGAADQLVDAPTSSFTESIRSLQLGMLLPGVGVPPKVIIVSSSVPGEGKTTVAISLARLAALGGKRVVLIDCDLRRPKLGSVLGMRRAKSGIAEALTGKAPLDTCIYKDKQTPVMVLPCVSVPPNPADLLLSDAMEKLIGQLKGVFDLVIVDTAPLLPVNDTRILAKLADAVLLVVRWEKTPRQAVLNAINGLGDSKPPIAGVALARVDMTRFRFYNYGYQNYGSYKKYYND